jgi:hypothetical protein
MEAAAIPIVVIISILYTFVFVVACGAMASTVNFPTSGGLGDRPWIPARARRDACLAPIFFILPALFWPVTPWVILGWKLVKSSTTCCGIPLPRRWIEPVQRDGIMAAAAASAESSSYDLEMGPVVTGTQGGAATGEPGGGRGNDDPTVAGVCSADSGGSEQPPSYNSLAPSEDDDDSGETDGLLSKGTSG